MEICSAYLMRHSCSHPGACGGVKCRLTGQKKQRRLSKAFCSLPLLLKPITTLMLNIIIVESCDIVRISKIGGQGVMKLGEGISMGPTE